MAGEPQVFDCPSCAGSVSIRAIGQTLAVACQSCGSVIDASNKNHAILQRVQQAITPGIIPLGTRGKIFGALWEVIGFMRRSDGSDTYIWDEYLLYHPGRGFRWLTEFGGHWNFVVMTKEKPEEFESFRSRKYVTYLDKDYFLFHVGKAKVVGVLGEFYWKVRAGDRVSVRDYVYPPEMLSQEKTSDETVWSVATYVEKEKIQETFGIPPEKMPTVLGVAPNQPSTLNDSSSSMGFFWVMFLLLFSALQFFFMVRARNENVFSKGFSPDPTNPNKIIVSEPFELKGGRANLAFDFEAPVSNSWFEAQVELVEDGSGETVEFEQGVEYYHGRDSDGAWSEGSNRSRRILSSIPEGTYHLNIQTTSSAGVLPFHLEVRRDVIRWANYFWGVVLLSIFPIFFIWRSRRFEVERWSTSDFSPYYYGGDED